jgi:glutamate dehydrogenase/leucine dehydrogenase
MEHQSAKPNDYYDIIHSHYWISGQLGWMISERTGVPLIHTMHTMAKVKNQALAEGDIPEPLIRALGEEQIVQNAKALIANGVQCVAEGANMPSTPEAIAAFQAANVLFAPGKASNAGGVATSGLEMSQNSLRLSWSAEEVDQRLHGIMVSIHEACVKYGKDASGNVDYVKGANVAGFVKVADAMIDQGLV